MRRDKKGMSRRRIVWVASSAGAVVMLAGLIVPSLVAGPAWAAGSSVTGATLQVGSLSASATEVPYTVTFRSADALVGGTGTITLVFPAGTVLPTSGCGFTLSDDQTQTSGCASASVTGTTAVVTVPAGIPVAAGDPVSVRVEGIGNPSTSGARTIDVSTSAQPTPVGLGYRLTATAGVQGAVLTLSSSSAGATNVMYSLQFVSPGRLAGNSTSAIALSAPGATFPAGGDYNCTDVTTQQVNFCSLASGGGTSAVTLRVDTSNPGDLLSIQVFGVTNPTSTGSHALSVSTTSDPATVTRNYTIVAAQSVQDSFVQLSSYAPSATGVTWSIGFVAPQRMSGGSSTITLTAPAGTVFPSGALTCWDPSTDSPNACSTTVGGGSNALTVDVNTTTNAGDAFDVIIPDVTNPATMSAATLATSSDPAPVDLSLAGPSAPSPYFEIGSTSAGATLVPYYVMWPTTGAMTSSTDITLSGPAGTKFPICGSSEGYFELDFTTGQVVGLGTTASCSSQPSDTITLTNGLTTTAGDVVGILAFGVQNSSSTGSQVLSLSTSPGAGSASYDFSLTAPTSPMSPFLQLDSRSASASQAQYAVSFLAHGAVPASSFAAWASITLSAATGTVFPAGGTYTVWDDTTGKSAGASGVPASNPSTVTVYPGSGDGFWAAPGDIVTVAVEGVANPSTSGSFDLSVSTGGDPAPASVAYTLTSSTGVTDPLLQLSSFHYGATGVTWSLTFEVTNGLTADYSSITIDSPPGTGYPPGSGGGDGFSCWNDTTGLGAGAYATITGSEAVVGCGTGDGFWAAPGDMVTVQITPVTNPTSGKEITLSTSTDPSVVVFR